MGFGATEASSDSACGLVVADRDGGAVASDGGVGAGVRSHPVNEWIASIRINRRTGGF
jgi:hypothetical protein